LRTATASGSQTTRQRAWTRSARSPTSSLRTFPRRRPDPLDSLRSLLEELPDDLARQAFTHSSWVERRTQSYERLAFLGDVVLSIAVSNHIYPRFPEWGAGRLTKLRAQAVSRTACAEVARQLEVPERLRRAAPEGVGKNAEVLIVSDRILASVCEAIIGAAYLAFGIERVGPAVVEAFSGELEEALESPVDHKSVLQETLARHSEVVGYRIVEAAGPAHARSFTAVAEVAGEEVGRGQGKTKKAAEQEAAERALEHVAEHWPDPGSAA
jgi:ribonuclease-3